MANPDQLVEPAADSVWDRFQAAHGPVLAEWLHAEKRLAGTLASGVGQSSAGDSLLAAEAELQGAIVDFATKAADGDPTTLALILLRLAEARLAESAAGSRSPASAPVEAPSGTAGGAAPQDRRRGPRS